MKFWGGKLFNPFSIFSYDLIQTRNLDLGVMHEEFDEYANFILEDLEAFFGKLGEQIGDITWAQGKTVMINDKDIYYYPTGRILYQKLFDNI